MEAIGIADGEEHLHQRHKEQHGNDGSFAPEIIKWYRHQERGHHIVDADLGQRPQPACALQHGHLSTRDGQQGHNWREQDEVQRVVAPRERPFVQQRTGSQTHQHAQQSREQAPRANELDAVVQSFGIIFLVSIGDFAYSTHRQAEVCGVAHQLDGRVEERRQAHAFSTQQYRHELCTHDAYQDADALHTAEDTGVFQDM